MLHDCSFIILINFIYFSGVMTSMITSPKEPEYIEEPKDIFLQDYFRVIVQSGSALEHIGHDYEEGTLFR